MSGAGDDDSITLSPAALAALLEFRREKASKEEAAAHEDEDTSTSLLMAEDYGASQFWYSSETSEFLAAEVRWCYEQVRKGHVVFLSSPSAYKAYRSMARLSSSGGGSGSAAASPPPPAAHLFEFDTRFAVFGSEFVHYDYNHPLQLPAHLLGACSVVMLDPPFLNHECLAAFAETVRALQLPGGETRVLLATGAVQLQSAAQLLGLRPTAKAILHAGGRLSNPFALYTNYEHQDTLGGWDEEAERAARQ
jgi:hypothetical protein